MFDVYLSGRHHLLVVRKGFPIPLADASKKWRKTKKRVVSASDEIRLAVERQGYYIRKLKDRKGSRGQAQIGVNAEEVASLRRGHRMSDHSSGGGPSCPAGR